MRGSFIGAKLQMKTLCYHHPVSQKHFIKSQTNPTIISTNYREVSIVIGLLMQQIRKSVIGIVFYFAGTAIHYKTKFQNNVSHSSTEAEFIAACDTGKFTQYLRSIFEDIGIPQHEATVILEDNTGALMMANVRQPTRRTKHMEV